MYASCIYGSKYPFIPSKKCLHKIESSYNDKTIITKKNKLPGWIYIQGYWRYSTRKIYTRKIKPCLDDWLDLKFAVIRFQNLYVKVADTILENKEYFIN